MHRPAQRWPGSSRRSAGQWRRPFASVSSASAGSTRVAAGRVDEPEARGRSSGSWSTRTRAVLLQLLRAGRGFLPLAVVDELLQRRRSRRRLGRVDVGLAARVVVLRRVARRQQLAARRSARLPSRLSIGSIARRDVVGVDLVAGEEELVRPDVRRRSASAVAVPRRHSRIRSSTQASAVEALLALVVVRVRERRAGGRSRAGSAGRSATAAAARSRAARPRRSRAPCAAGRSTGCVAQQALAS